jgi:hypothetical protein
MNWKKWKFYILIDLCKMGFGTYIGSKNLVKMNALKLMEEVKVLNLTMDGDVKQIHVVGRPTWGLSLNLLQGMCTN